MGLMSTRRGSFGPNRTVPGFTVIELIVALTVLLAAGFLFLVQKSDIQAQNRDAQRKTAVNAIYYNLEGIYYPAHQYYPASLGASELTGLDPAMLKDPAGKAVGDKNSTLRYEPQGCDGAGKCRGYTLRAILEKEAIFTKNSPAR